MPLKHKGAARSQYNYIAERMLSKLAGWKARFLSFAGRCVMVKSVLTAIPNYVMQGAVLPVHLCEKIDRISRDFLWGSSAEKKKLHLVGWSRIIMPKKDGGLGIQQARAKNIALLAKLNWRLYHEKDALWSKIVLNKYCSRARRISKDPDKLPCSSVWNAIKAGFPVFEKGVCWIAGTNSKLLFWKNNWLKGCSVRDMIEGPLTQSESELTVANVFQEGRWCWEKISFELPKDVLERVLSVPMQLFGEKEDTLIWKFSQNGEFSAASAYNLARNGGESPGIFSGDWLWNIDTAPKIQHFIWLCLHSSVPVRKTLADRGITSQKACPICQNHEESIIHLLRDCPFATKFWKDLGTPQIFSNFLHLNLPDWLKTNCLCSNQIHANGFSWNIQFPFAIWCLWKHRNKVVFDNAPPNSRLHLNCIQLAREFFFCVSKRQKTRHCSVSPICWNKPESGWYKLNSDGASQGNPGYAGGGGLIRDHNGKWVKGFMRNIGKTTSVAAEFWALRDGLMLAGQLGIDHLHVELDAQVVVNLVLSNKPINNSCAALLNDCRYLLEQFQHVKVTHVFREANKCADNLAKAGCSLPGNFVVLDVPPNEGLCSLLNADANGLCTLRLSARSSPFMAS